MSGTLLHSLLYYLHQLNFLSGMLIFHLLCNLMKMFGKWVDLIIARGKTTDIQTFWTTEKKLLQEFNNKEVLCNLILSRLCQNCPGNDNCLSRWYTYNLISFGRQEWRKGVSMLYWCLNSVELCLGFFKTWLFWIWLDIELQ